MYSWVGAKGPLPSWSIINHLQSGTGAKYQTSAKYQKYFSENREDSPSYDSHYCLQETEQKVCTGGYSARPPSHSCGLVKKGSWGWGGSNRGGGWTVVPPKTSSPTALFISLCWAFWSYFLIMLEIDIIQVSINPTWNSDNTWFLWDLHLNLINSFEESGVVPIILVNPKNFYSQDVLVCNPKISM